MGERMKEGAFHLPKIPSTCYLTANRQTTSSPPVKKRVKDNNNNNKRKNTSLYSLHCFFKLASQELSPAYRKQAVEGERASHVTINDNTKDEQGQQHQRTKKRGSQNNNNKGNNKNKQVVFSNARTKVSCVNKFKNGARKRKERSISLLDERQPPPPIAEEEDVK